LFLGYLGIPHSNAIMLNIIMQPLTIHYRVGHIMKQPLG
jgi:hypothetical protein